MQTDDRDTSADTTVPNLQAGQITVFLAEDEPSRLVPAHRYDHWAYVDAAELGLTRAERSKAKASKGPRVLHIIHVPSGRSVATLSSEVRADELARALAARCPTFGKGCSLGDTPDDGEEIRDMVMVIAEVAPIALVGGHHPAAKLAAAHRLASSLDDAGAYDTDVVDEGVAA